MGTIVTFKPNIDYYYSRGLNQYESDNFIDALKNYREAYNLTENTPGEDFRSVLEVEMACCYRNLNLLRETQLMYYKALANSNIDASFDSIIGLVDVFGTNNNEEALKYYMDLAAKSGFSRELDYIDAATQFYSQRDYRVEPTPDENMLELGKKLLDAGQFEFARQLLEVIPPESSARGEACVKLAALYNGSGDGEKALEYVREAEKRGENRIEVLVNRVLALYKSDKKEEAESAIAELADCDTEEIGALAQLIRVAALIGNGDLVIKFGRRLCGVSPQKNPMLCYALALSNRGDLREARKMMVTLQALYPYDAVIKTFAVLISRAAEPTDFSLTCELPEGVEADLLAELNGVLNECGTDRAALRTRLRDPKLRTGILMIFQAGSDNSKRILADIVAEVPFFERYMRDCLMDPGYPDSDKRILLPIALKRFKKRPVFLTCRDICRPLFGRPPARISDKWREAYYSAYSAIALFGCENFEREFDAAFDKLHAALGNEGRLDEVALAALLANRTRRVSALRDDECCIELFGADRETYMHYKQKSDNKKPDNKRSDNKRK